MRCSIPPSSVRVQTSGFPSISWGITWSPIRSRKNPIDAARLSVGSPTWLILSILNPAILGTILELDYEFDLDRDAVWQASHADGGSCVFAVLSEDFDH